MSLVENVDWKVFLWTVEAFLFMPVHSRPTMTTRSATDCEDRGFHAPAKTTLRRVEAYGV
jgi:hypothetical protein